MRSAPTLNSWMTPFSSVAMLEKLALLRIAFCSAPVLSSAASRRTSEMPDGVVCIAQPIEARTPGPCAGSHSSYGGLGGDRRACARRRCSPNDMSAVFGAARRRHPLRVDHLIAINPDEDAKNE